MTKKARRVLHKFRIDEISAVDLPAQQGARMVLMKRAGAGDLIDEVLDKAARKTEDGQEFPAGDFAYVPDPDKPGTWKLRLTGTPGGDPDPKIVGAAVAALGPGYRGRKVQIPDADRPAVMARVKRAWLKANPDKDSDELPDVLKAFIEEDEMSKELEEKVAALTADLEKSKADLEKARAEADLTDAQRAFYKSLAQDKQAGFLKLDSKAREAEIEKAAKADETFELYGRIVRKSAVGEDLFEIMKKQAEDVEKANRIAREEREKREEAELHKRAEAELSHLPGDVATRAALLKAVDSISDSKVREEAQKALKANNEAMAKAFVRTGSRGDGKPESSAEGQLESLAKRYAEEHKLDYAKAYSEVLRTDEGKKLYEEANEEANKKK